MSRVGIICWHNIISLVVYSPVGIMCGMFKIMFYNESLLRYYMHKFCGIIPLGWILVSVKGMLMC